MVTGHLSHEPFERRDHFELATPTGDQARFSKYNGFLFTFQKRFSDRWQAFLSYTYSTAEGILNSNHDGPAASQDSDARFSGGRFGRDPNDFTNAEGKLLNDRPRVQSSF